MYAREMTITHPNAVRGVNSALVHCVEDAYACAQACAACADACLGEPHAGQLSQCIRLNLDCSDICLAAGRIATRRTGENDPVVVRVLKTCAEACARCAAECQRHAARLEHCRICAVMCRECEESCREALAGLKAAPERALAH
jgi:hypothetical protein